MNEMGIKRIIITKKIKKRQRKERKRSHKPPFPLLTPTFHVSFMGKFDINARLNHPLTSLHDNLEKALFLNYNTKFYSYSTLISQ